MPESIRRGPDGQPSYQRGRRYPAWALIAAPFLALTAFLATRAKGVSLKSLLLLVLLFEITVIVVEHNSVMIGHWVYNRNRILGLTVWGVPIEEPLIYYLFPPIMVVIVMHLVAGFLKKRR